MGHGSARIARALGVREMTIRQIVRGDARTVSPRLRDAITELYDAWWDKRAPARTRFDRGAATAARKRAIAGNWCAAAALDDDLLDIPGYRPRHGWKPATGTGVAPDVRPRRPPSPEGPPMTSDHRVTPGLVHDILDALERHGYYRSDDLHADRAIGLIGDLACIYEGTQDHPASPACHRAAACLPRTDSRDAVTLTRGRRQHRVRRAGYRRRRQALPRRDVPRLRRPVLPRLPDPPPRRPGLRPDGRPHAPGRPGRPRCHSQPARARSLVPARRRPGGRPVTPARRKPAEPANRPAATPRIPGPRAGERDMPETAEPYDLPFPDQWPPPPGVRDRRRPAPRLAA